MPDTSQNPQQVIEQIARWHELTPADRSDLLRRLQSSGNLTAADVSALITALAALARTRTDDAPAELLAAATDAILTSRRARTAAGAAGLSESDTASLVELYKNLFDAEHAPAAVLRLLATDASPSALQALAGLLADQPPRDHRQAAWGITPLVQRKHFDVDAVFPRLLDALAHRQTAALVLDLANFVARQNPHRPHPAAVRSEELTALLGQVVQQLQRIEENPGQMGQPPDDLRATVDESVALCIALCDALALIGHTAGLGKLHQALELGHRRIRTEAAAAMARLDDEQGIKSLAQLASDPATRTRALAYLEELDALDRARPGDCTPAARAAAELSDWLAESSQFGAPPHAVEWIDTCRQYWPGYTDPIECRLFVYTYRFHDGELSGVGIVGPVTFSLASDLEDLPPDDIYAAFAGWQAEHEEMLESAADDLPDWKRKQHESRLEQLASPQYRDVQLVKVAHFFGDELLVADAHRDGHTGTLVVDQDQLFWYPAGTTRRPIGTTEAYYIHKGRKLLANFNPEGGTHLDESLAPQSDSPDTP